MGTFNIDKDMLPMKGHFFLFNAGTAPLVPFLPTYAKQLGFSSSLVGIIYTFLPIFGLIAKPLFGAIADRFEKHKFIFILFQIITIFAFSGLYFIPETPKSADVHLSCGNSEVFFSTCVKNGVNQNECIENHIASNNGTTSCHMSCVIDKPSMWQTICEHWKVPKYCYNETEFRFSAKIPKSSISSKGNCAYFNLKKVTLSDNKEYTPMCSSKYNDAFKTTCSLYCSDKRIEDYLDNSQNLVCNDNVTQFIDSCGHSTEEVQSFVNSFSNDSGDVECNAICNMASPLNWMNMCLNWEADQSQSCHPAGTRLPSTFNFSALVPLEKTIREGDCLYFKISEIVTSDGSTHFPICPAKSEEAHFATHCSTWCENHDVNDVLITTSASTNSSESYEQFWLFFGLMAINWIGMAVVVSIADAICFEKLGARAELYGKQRLWGSAGWGILSLLTGYLIDTFSENQGAKNYLVAFIMMLVFLSLDILVSIRLQYKQKSISVNILKKVGVLFSNRHTIQFFIWIVLVGMCTGLLWQFLFWYLEDLAKASDCEQTVWIKTLQGFVSGTQCFLGEIPFFFFSGYILKKIGHTHSMSLVLLGFGIRFILYSLLTNPWWVLPIELFQGLTFGMLYATMASYASILAPAGTEATLQGLVGAIFEGVGTALGSFIGGTLYDKIGGARTFRIFGLVALSSCLLNVVITLIACRPLSRAQGEESSIIRYATPIDAVHMLNEPDEDGRS